MVVSRWQGCSQQRRTPVPSLSTCGASCGHFWRQRWVPRRRYWRETEASTSHSFTSVTHMHSPFFPTPHHTLYAAHPSSCAYIRPFHESRDPSSWQVKISYSHSHSHSACTHARITWSSNTGRVSTSIK